MFMIAVQRDVGLEPRSLADTEVYRHTRRAFIRYGRPRSMAGEGVAQERVTRQGRGRRKECRLESEGMAHGTMLDDDSALTPVPYSGGTLNVRRAISRVSPGEGSEVLAHQCGPNAA